MSENLVPIEDLPPEARAAVAPGTPAFRSYAERLEAEHSLPKGSLSGADFSAKEGTDPLWLLQSAALDAKKNAASPAKPKFVMPVSAPYNPMEGMDRTDRALVGAGKMFSDFGRGVGQIFGATPQGEIDEVARRDAPIMRDPWGLTGYIGGSAIASSPLTGGLGALANVKRLGPVARLLANRYGLGAAAGAGWSSLQPVESGSSRGAQAAVGGLGGLVGTALGQGTNALVRGAGTYASAAVRALADKAEQAGIPLRAADISQSKALHALQGILDHTPFSGAQQREGAQKAFTKAITRTLGEDSDDMLAALRASRSRNEQVYDVVTGRNKAEFDPAVHGQKLLDAFNKFKARDVSEGKTVSQQLDDYLANLVDPANAVLNPRTGKFEMSGKLYKDFRSEAATLARSYKKAGETGSNPQGAQLATFYNAVKEQLDHSLRNSRTMSAGDKAALKKADKEWGNMRTLENLAPKDASGDVDFSALAKVMNRRDANNIYNRSAFVYGRGDQTLPDIARIGTQFLERGDVHPRLAPWMHKAAHAAPYALGVPALGAGLYSLNAHEEHPLLSTIGELGGLALASKGAGSVLNSQWFAKGAAPWIQKAVSSGNEVFGNQVPRATLDALLRRGAPDASFEEGAER